MFGCDVIMWFGWGFMLMGPIGLVLIALILYYAFTVSSRRERPHTSYNQQPQYYGGRALDILKERYVKGEITKEEFLQMKQELR